MVSEYQPVSGSIVDVPDGQKVEEGNDLLGVLPAGTMLLASRMVSAGRMLHAAQDAASGAGRLEKFFIPVFPH